MSLTVVIPDVHHDWDWVNAILGQYDDETRYVFLGDYVDYKRIRTYDHLQSCRFLIETMDRLGDRAQWLMGNHDLQYHPLNERLNGLLACSGRDYGAAKMLTAEMPWERMRIAAAVHGFLCTHAGLGSFPELAELRTADELASRINQDWKDLNEDVSLHRYLLKVGRSSGGYAQEGGPFWHRPEEGKLADVNQFCGHTPHKQPRDFADFNEKTPYQHWHIDTIQTHWAELDDASPAPRFRFLGDS